MTHYPTRTGPWQPVLQRMETKAPSAQTADDLTEEQALGALHQMFQFNAQSRRVEGLSHPAVSSGKVEIRRCTHDTAFGTCNLARKAGETRCTFHENADRFFAAGFKAEDIYEGAPAEAQIAARHGTLSL